VKAGGHRLQGSLCVLQEGPGSGGNRGAAQDADDFHERETSE
jgi:hypothetical protein